MTIKEYVESNDVLSNIQVMLSYVIISELISDGYIAKGAFDMPSKKDEANE